MQLSSSFCHFLRSLSNPSNFATVNFLALALMHLYHIFSSKKNEVDFDQGGIENIIRNIPATERAAFGFMCKEIVDTGRLHWLKENGFDAQLVSYVPLSISPENHLLVAKNQS